MVKILSVPWEVPILTAGAVLCTMLGLRARHQTTVFDREDKLPLKTEVIQFVRHAATIPWVAAIIGPKDMRELVDSADSPIAVDDIDLIRAVLMLLTITGAVFGILSGHVVLLLLVVLVKLPHLLLTRLAAKRTKAMSRDFIPVAARLAGALSAGMATTRALEWAAKNDSGVLAGEISFALDRARTGASLSQALRELADRTGLLDARRLATALRQSEEHGVPVGESLMAAVHDARERRKNEAAGKAQVAEQNMALAVLLMALPTVICTLAPLIISMSIQMGGAL